MICRHPGDGYCLVCRLPGMEVAVQIVASHEERFDGKGYPRALCGEAILFGARLFVVIDALDAMTSDRSYRRGLPFNTAREEILRSAGTQFDPIAIAAFVAEEAVLRSMVQRKCMDPESPFSSPPKLAQPLNRG